MSLVLSSQSLRAVGISGSPIPYSTKSRMLLVRALDRLARAGATRPEMIELALLPPEGLLGRKRDDAIDAALRAVSAAHIVVVATPIRRAAYSPLLRVFFDLLPESALEGKVALPIAQGGRGPRPVSLEHSLRPLLSGLGARVVAGDVYGTDEEFTENSPSAGLVGSLDRAAAAAYSLARSVALPQEMESRRAADEETRGWGSVGVG